MLPLVLAAAMSGPPAASLPARLGRALITFSASRAVIERQVGDSQAIDLGYRLVEDQYDAMLPVPASYAQDWEDTLSREAELDVQAVADLASQKPEAMSLARTGLHETFVRSSADGVLVPAAVYVPPNAKRGGPLALMLHGNHESETNLLGAPYFRRLADRTGTILIAPYGRGTYDFTGVAQTDVADVLRAASIAFAPDARQLYLVGYSMGGFSTFSIGPRMANWAAVMTVCGALDGNAAPVAFAWRSTPLYIVTGAHDGVVLPVYPRQTAAVLAGMDVPTSFYEEPAGEHWLHTLVPAMTRAWTDMHAGVVRSGSVPPPPPQALPHPPPINNDTKP